MSASLVGSEMCIRDSNKSRTTRETATSHNTTAPQLGEAAEKAWESCPVSYTHLTLPTICSV
eukprot:11762292-Alexandrium_andersonii.AAC.1